METCVTAPPSLSPTTPPAATSTPVPPSSAPTTPPAATSTPIPPSSDLLPPEITLTEPKEEAFVVHFRYPEEGSLVPTEFEVLVDGELYETTEYMGTDVNYSRFVSDQPCGATLQVQIVAVNGDSRAPSEAVEAQTGPC
jgi:hypothetical protein